MTTLAGAKIKRYRLNQVPRTTRADLGLRLDASPTTIAGWEEEGKRPRQSAQVNLLAEWGICGHADWNVPATCPRCTKESDDPGAVDCPRKRCALIPFRSLIEPRVEADEPARVASR